jgi:hypothetical protein
MDDTQYIEVPMVENHPTTGLVTVGVHVGADTSRRDAPPRPHLAPPIVGAAITLDGVTSDAEGLVGNRALAFRTSEDDLRLIVHGSRSDGGWTLHIDDDLAGELVCEIGTGDLRGIDDIALSFAELLAARMRHDQ